MMATGSQNQPAIGRRREPHHIGGRMAYARRRDDRLRQASQTRLFDCEQSSHVRQPLFTVGFRRRSGLDAIREVRDLGAKVIGLWKRSLDCLSVDAQTEFHRRVESITWVEFEIAERSHDAIAVDLRAAETCDELRKPAGWKS